MGIINVTSGKCSHFKKIFLFRFENVHKVASKPRLYIAGLPEYQLYCRIGNNGILGLVNGSLTYYMIHDSTGPDDTCQ